MEDKKKYEHPKCFLPEKGNPYPLLKRISDSKTHERD